MIIDFIKERLPLGSPLTLFLVLSVGVVLLYVRPSSRLARRFFLTSAIGFWFVTSAIGAGVLSAGLSHGLSQLQSRADAHGAEAVVVLGAGATTLSAGGQIAGVLTTTSVLRVLEAARVSKVIDARVVIASGGIPRPDLELRPESVLLREALVAAGVPPERIVEESASRSTREQAHVIPPLLRAHGARQFVLVTSPAHMRRALAVFRLEGTDPVPSVSLTRSEQIPPPPLLIPNDESLGLSSAAAYDYAAWVYYWWNGWLTPRRPG